MTADYTLTTQCDTPETNDQDKDEVDGCPEKLSFSWFHICVVLYSIISYIFDVALDIVVMYGLYEDGRIFYFSLTLAFILVPSLATMLFSLKWYITDYRMTGAPKPSAAMWTLRIILLVLQLGPTLRYIDVLRFGIMFRQATDPVKKIKYYRWMIYEDADASLLRLFEAFLEAAPQLVLQIYILSHLDQSTSRVSIQVVSCIVSLLSLSWALSSQQRAMRFSLQSAKNPSVFATIVQSFWYFFVLGSRVLSLGLFVTLFPVQLAIICAVRWLVMTTWLHFMKTTFCDTWFEEFLYTCVLGVVFLFCYFNPVNSPTRWRYLFYYLYTFIEDTILILVWYSWAAPDTWYGLAAVLAVILSFFVGIFFMILYYLLLHPTGSITIIQSDNETKESKTRPDECEKPEHKKIESVEEQSRPMSSELYRMTLESDI